MNIWVTIGALFIGFILGIVTCGTIALARMIWDKISGIPRKNCAQCDKELRGFHWTRIINDVRIHFCDEYCVAEYIKEKEQ